MNAFTEDFSDLEIAINLRNITIGTGQKEHRSYLKIVFQLVRFINFSRKKGRSEHFPSIKTLAENSECCERTVQYFLNSQFFKLYGERIFRKGESTCYRLNEWVIRLFSMIQGKGIMKNIKDCFHRFHKRYKKFMDISVIPQLEKGDSLQGVLNKLCTKNEKILHPSPQKYCTLAASLSELAKPTQQTNHAITKPVEEDRVSMEFNAVKDLLKVKLRLTDQEAIGFIFKNSLGMVKKAAVTISSWMYGGYMFNHTAAVLQSQINKLYSSEGKR